MVTTHTSPTTAEILHPSIPSYSSTSTADVNSYGNDPAHGPENTDLPPTHPYLPSNHTRYNGRRITTNQLHTHYKRNRHYAS